MNHAPPPELLDGFRRFQRRHFGHEGSLFERLRACQSPATMIIACCDSRADPALLTEAVPGEVFVIRNVANLVPPYQHAAKAPGIRSAIEFGIKALQVAHVIVLGHSGCGGIRALMSSGSNCDSDVSTGYEFVDKWMTIAEPAKSEVKWRMSGASLDAQCRACELQSIRNSVRNLHSFPWISRAVADNGLSVHGWYFDMENGALLSPTAHFNEPDALVPAICRAPTRLPSVET